MAISSPSTEKGTPVMVTISKLLFPPVFGIVTLPKLVVPSLRSNVNSFPEVIDDTINCTVYVPVFNPSIK